MKKRLLSAILAAVMLLAATPAFAETDGAVAKTYTLTLSDAILMGQTKSPKLAALGVTEKTTEYSLKLAKQNMAKVEGVPVKMPTGINTALMQDGYFVAQLENSLNLLKSEREQINASIAYGITEKYYNSILMKNLLESSKATYNLAVENKAKVDTMLELGMITEIEADNAELAVLSAKLAVENYERQLGLTEDMLKIALEFSDEDYENAKVVLTDNVVYEDFTADVNKDTELAKAQRYDMRSLKGNLDLMTTYTELIRSHLGTKSTTYTDATDDLANLEYNYNNALRQIGIAVKSQYSNVLAAKGNIKTAEMAVNVNKSQYEAAKLRFDLGMITNIDLTDSLNKLHESEIALEQAKINYALAVEKYKYEVAIGL